MAQVIKEMKNGTVEEISKARCGISKPRLHLIDEIRGFWLINMIIYHAVWDLVYIFGCNWKWYKSDMAFYWQQAICWSFIFISGFCWKMSKRNLKRGLQVFGGGLVITFATLIFMPDSRVIFGVLTLIGSSMLLMIPCDKVLRKVNPVLGGVISFLVFLVVYPVNEGYLGIGGKEWVTLPRELYNSLFSTYLGFPEPGFWSTDYFSVLPWFFLYMTGYFMHGVVFKNEEKITIYRGENVRGTKTVHDLLGVSVCPTLGWIGRNALIIYMLHQPVVYGVLTVWNMLR